MPPEPEEIPAEVKWGKIDTAIQKKLLANVFCGKCGITTMGDYVIETAGPDIVLQGKCAKCGGKAARLIECD